MFKFLSLFSRGGTQKAVPAQTTSLWRNRDYMLLWGGQVISSLGSQMSQIAFPLFILALTRSPAQAGFAAALRALPYLVFTLPAGVFIDRWNRKYVMIICDTGRALCLASIPLAFVLGYLTIIQIYLVSLIEGTFYVFFSLAQVACLPRVVSKEQLPAATAQNITISSIASLIGSPLGGVLYSVGRLLPFLTDAISYTFSVFSLFLIRTSFQEERVAAQHKMWVGIKEGLLWIWDQPLICFLALLTGGVNLATAGFTLIIIVLANQMHAPAYAIGMIFSIGAVGTIGGALLATRIQRHFSFGRILATVCWLAAIFWSCYAIAPNVIVLGVITAAFLGIFPIYDVVQFSYRSGLIPDELQGRVNSVFRLIAYGGQPLGAALTGILLQYVHVLPTILIISAVFLILALLTMVNRHVRHARPLIEIREQK